MNVPRLKALIFDKDETMGYIERETWIDVFLHRAKEEPSQAVRYTLGFELIMDNLSTPIDPDDLILGRMVEGPLDFEMEFVSAGGKSHVNNPFKVHSRNAGHMSLDYRHLLTKGLRGILAAMEQNAATPEQQQYVQLLDRCIQAIRRYCTRYAAAARAAGHERAAKALSVVPFEPAYDFFSAVQSLWMMEMLLSCVVGGRDFAYSRLDLALLPFFDAQHPDDALNILTAFLIKNNEIGGMGSELDVHMPVPCAATNLYLMLGGTGAEAALPLDLLFLQAATAVRLPQPVLALRVDAHSPDVWLSACAQAAQALNGQVSIYNDTALIANLQALGFSAEQAQNYTMSGCNRVETMGHQSSDAFHNCPQWLLEAFYDEQVHTMDDLLAAFVRVARQGLEPHTGNERVDPGTELHLNLESLFLSGCVERATDIENGGLAMETFVHNLCGIATLADSLAAIQTLVFEEKRFTLEQYRHIVKNNFHGQEALLLWLKNKAPKYGNDDPRADRWATIAGSLLANAVREKTGERIHIPSFYSLYFHQHQGARLGATPDGRAAGEPISENQSPVYGCDTQGATALLHSASALPQQLCGAGGLNLRLARPIQDEQLAALIKGYFSMGGVNLAPYVLSKQTLLAAREHPDQYKNLCVRIVGYSEVYLRLPEQMQLELLNRTEVAL